MIFSHLTPCNISALHTYCILSQEITIAGLIRSFWIFFYVFPFIVFHFLLNLKPVKASFFDNSCRTIIKVKYNHLLFISTLAQTKINIRHWWVYENIREKLIFFLVHHACFWFDGTCKSWKQAISVIHACTTTAHTHACNYHNNYSVFFRIIFFIILKLSMVRISLTCLWRKKKETNFIIGFIYSSHNVFFSVFFFGHAFIWRSHRVISLKI